MLPPYYSIQKYGYLFLFAWFLCFLIIIIPIFLQSQEERLLKDILFRETFFLSETLGECAL